MANSSEKLTIKSFLYSQFFAFLIGNTASCEWSFQIVPISVVYSVPV